MILVLSDGKDSGPIDFRQRYVSQGEVIDRARDDDVMIYGVGMRSRPHLRRIVIEAAWAYWHRRHGRVGDESGEYSG